MGKSLGYYKHYIIAIILGVLIKLFLPATNGLTEIGVNVLAIIVPGLWLWIFDNTDWASLLIIIGMAVSGVMTFGDAYKGSMGNFIATLTIVCMVLSNCLSETGVIKKIANWFMSQKMVEGHPYKFIIMFLLSYTIFALFMDSVAITVIYINIGVNICDRMNYHKGESFYTAIMGGILWMGAVTTVASPISHVLALVMMGLAGGLGIQISYAKWLAVGIPFTIIMFVVSMLIIRFIWKPDTSKYANYDIEQVRKEREPLSLQGKITLGVFILVIIAWLLPEVAGSIFPHISGFLSRVGSTFAAIVAVSLLCIIRVNGKPIANFAQMVKNVPLGVIIFTAAVLLMGTAINSPEAGITVCLQNVLGPVIGGVSPYVLVLITAIGAIILTNFISNSVTQVLFFNLAVPLAASMGNINLPLFAILISISSGMGVLVASANALAPLLFGGGHVNTKNLLKPNLCFILASFIIIGFIMYPLFSLFIS